MDWGALLGGLIGAGIPAILTYLGLHRARQASDAEAFGPALLLLERIDPDRVSVNVSADLDVETAKWADLAKQNEIARAGLLVVSAGHPRRRVRELAETAQIKLANAYNDSRWQADDMAHHKGDQDWRAHAKETHAEAVSAVRAVINASTRWRP